MFSLQVMWNKASDVAEAYRTGRAEATSNLLSRIPLQAGDRLADLVKTL